MNISNMQNDTGNTQPDVNTAIAQTKLLLYKDYLQCMDQAQVVGCEQDGTSEQALRLIHIDTLLYDQEESIAEKLKALFGAVENYGESVALIINGKRDRVDIYMGVACQSAPQPVFNTFLRSLNSLLPGCQYKILHNDAIRRVMNDVLPNIDITHSTTEDALSAMEEVHISAVSAFPFDEQASQEPLQKLDVLIDGMRHSPFSMVLLAQSIRPDELSVMQQQLQRLYTDLSVIEKTSLTVSQSNSQSIGESVSKAITDSIGYNASLSRGHSSSSGTSVSNSPASPQGNSANSGAMYLAGTAAALLFGSSDGNGGSGANSANGARMPNLYQAMSQGNALARLATTALSFFSPDDDDDTPATVSTTSSHQEESTNESKQVGKNTSHSTNEQKGINANINNTYGKTQQITQANKFISDLLTMLDTQLKQLTLFQREGAFQTAAYFIAGDSETAVSAANLYRSICTSGRLPSLRAPICQWNETGTVSVIEKYLSVGQHPIFKFKHNDTFPEVQMAQLIGLRDMPRYFALPERTLPGMVASTSARFARDIIAQNTRSASTTDRSVHIGCIYHMGKEDPRTNVHLSIDDLTKHLFVAGATGVGKSNFCYQLLDELDQRGIKMLIVEPAKGEYRHVMGGRDGFHVYGVDPATGPVLRINPFAFPDSIPTIQHIERLLDIFNTAWPLYSAMPAILKEAVELIYTERGFNLIGGGRPKDATFPSFNDLLETLPRVINQSSYSNEVKGNYIGALVTRVKSLTNGLYGLIFSPDEIGDEGLFQTNVIADISRIGSAETKALLMGVLTTRLIEYRMAEGYMNSPLRHVTVLEEAHHLLRRHNPSSEGSNARAASVEMLASAIAEMRSSGEGFIIADQSPSVMDWSVIRNTQTKVFFMLPDREDRVIAGNSLSLNEAQQQEIAKLRPGVAAVYQNGWADAVLCKINFFDKSRERPFISTPVHVDIDHQGLLGQALAILLQPRLTDAGATSLNAQKIDVYRQYDSIWLSKEEKEAQQLLCAWTPERAKDISSDDIYAAICRILPFQQILKRVSQAQSISDWVNNVSKSIAHHANLTDEELKELIQLGLYRWSAEAPHAKRLYIRYLELVNSAPKA